MCFSVFFWHFQDSCLYFSYITFRMKKKIIPRFWAGFVHGYKLHGLALGQFLTPKEQRHELMHKVAFLLNPVAKAADGSTCCEVGLGGVELQDALGGVPTLRVEVVPRGRGLAVNGRKPLKGFKQRLQDTRLNLEEIGF